jgi:Uma2 family endonuclease
MSTSAETPATRPLTAEEFAAIPNPADGSQLELVRGEVVAVSPPSFLHGLVQANLAYQLKRYVKQTNAGRVTVESGVLTETGPDTVRGPDAAFWSYQRLPADQTPVVFANVAPDLAVEVVSPSNSRKDIAGKVREYFAGGAKLVWIVDPDERTVTIYHKPGDGQVLWDDAILNGADVLPGFSCAVAELFS